MGYVFAGSLVHKKHKTHKTRDASYDAEYPGTTQNNKHNRRHRSTTCQLSRQRVSTVTSSIDDMSATSPARINRYVINRRHVSYVAIAYQPLRHQSTTFQLRRQRVSTVTYYPVSWLNVPNTTDYTDTLSTLMKQKCNLHPSAHTSNNVLRDAPPMYTTRAAQLRSFCWLLYPAKN